MILSQLDDLHQLHLHCIQNCISHISSISFTVHHLHHQYHIYTTYILYIMYINFICITCIINISHNNFINIININPRQETGKSQYSWKHDVRKQSLFFFGRHIASERVTSQSAAPVSSHGALFLGVLKWWVTWCSEVILYHPKTWLSAGWRAGKWHCICRLGFDCTVSPSQRLRIFAPWGEGSLELLLEFTCIIWSSCPQSSKPQSYWCFLREEGKNMYVVSIIPQQMAWEVAHPAVLLCGSRRNQLNRDTKPPYKKKTHEYPHEAGFDWMTHVFEANLWIATGYTRSQFHYDKEWNVNCLLSGTKRWIFLDPLLGLGTSSPISGHSHLLRGLL